MINKLKKINTGVLLYSPQSVYERKPNYLIESLFSTTYLLPPSLLPVHSPIPYTPFSLSLTSLFVESVALNLIRCGCSVC